MSLFGIGMATAFKRVRPLFRERGRIQAENNVGRGATFRCFLPLADGHADIVAGTTNEAVL